MDSPAFSLEVESLDIMRGRMIIGIRVRGDRCTSQVLAARVLNDHPNVAFHACRNDAGPVFGDVIADTSIPHLLEHLIIDEQIRAEAEGSDRVFVGSTEWVCKDSGRARIEVNFISDITALAALRRALDYLDDQSKHDPLQHRVL